jgi:hypothetical protein
MQLQKYSVNQQSVSVLLAWVQSGEIAIPEIQRPFVWDSTKVRDLMDSLYNGFPVGYVIAWQNPNVRLKDGGLAKGKKILIDGQQRVTALRAALLGEQVINKNYDKVKITIAFNPKEERFEVSNPAILKDKYWLPDIAELVNGGSILKIVKKYTETNPDVPEDHVEQAVSTLLDIPKKQIGIIDLASELDIETVTEIFIRINSQGVVLSQADFAMSKIAANESYGGSTLRKAIDYFCNIAVSPEFYSQVKEKDKEFVKTDYFNKMAWLKDEKEDLYDPSYVDLLRVAFTKEFNRGRLSDLVSLLSGRNFETRTFEEQIASDSFKRLSASVMSFMNEIDFKRFIMIIRSAGFIIPEMIRSQNALNFAYIAYLKLREKGEKPAEIERFVARWFVYSILTGRYSGSPESTFDFDIRQIAEKPSGDILKEREQAELSDAFWDFGLTQNLDSSVASSPYFNIYQAAQVKANDRGFLSRDITVGNLITYRGDIHHIFPRNYLKKNNLSRGRYNQIANYVYMQQEINIKIGDKSPDVYFKQIQKQCNGEKKSYGGIETMKELNENLKAHCIPESIFEMSLEHYDEFLQERRKLMAGKIKEYYYEL